MGDTTAPRGQAQALFADKRRYPQNKEHKAAAPGGVTRGGGEVLHFATPKSLGYQATEQAVVTQLGTHTTPFAQADERPQRP